MKEPTDYITATHSGLDESEAACVIYDQEGRLVSCDDNFRVLFNYSEEDVRPGVHHTELDRLDLERGAILFGDEQNATEHYLTQKAQYRNHGAGSFVFQLKNRRWIRITDRPLSGGGFVSIQLDITEKLRSEEELRRTNELFMAAFHFNNNICTITVLATGEYLDVNKTWLDLLGYQRHEVIGKTSLQLSSWGSTQNRADFVREIQKNGRVQNYESISQTKDGEQRDVLISANVLKVSGVECLFFSAQDVTDQRRAERAIQFSEKRFRTIFENAPIGMALFNNRSNKVKIANKRFLDIIGRNREEFDDLDWIQITHPDDVNDGLEKLRQLNNNEFSMYKMVKRYVRPDGTIVLAEVSVVAIETGNPHEPVQLLSMIEDITEKKETERALNHSKEQFADFALASADWYWETDKDTCFTFISSVVEKGTGIDNSQYLGATLWEMLGDDYTPQDSLDHLDYCLTHQQSYRDLTYFRIHAQSGQKVWIKASGIPFYDEAGLFQGFRGVSSEVTEQKAVEEKLQQSQKMETVGQLTGGVAHDFNNLLAVIVGNAELLGENLDRGDTLNKNQLNAILRAGERGAELTQSMLAFSRKQDLQPRILQLDDQVQAMISLLRRTLGETIEIRVKVAADLWSCKADPGKVENALLNMAINARDAMPTGGTLTIEISNYILDQSDAVGMAEIEPGKYVMLCVCDTGTGIEPDALQHVFEPFYTTKEIGKGTGLGLSMVYGFAQQSKGHVTIASEPGQGTILKLYLPHVAGTQEASALTRRSARKKVEGTILVVEDDPDVRALTLSLLQTLGYETIEAVDGEEALAVLDQTNNIDLLLTDAILPGKMNGPDVAKESTKRRPDLKVLYMSGYTEDAFPSHDLTSENSILLQKPFRKADLADKINLVLHGQK